MPRAQQKITPSDPFARAAGVFSGRHADKWRKRRTLEVNRGDMSSAVRHPRSLEFCAIPRLSLAFLRLETRPCHCGRLVCSCCGVQSERS